jgi:hypothetical protein
MKPLLWAGAIAAATSVLGTPAQAQTYPWCAQYSSGPLEGVCQLPPVHGHRYWNRRVLRVRASGAACPAALLSELSIEVWISTPCRLRRRHCRRQSRRDAFPVTHQLQIQ